MTTQNPECTPRLRRPLGFCARIFTVATLPAPKPRNPETYALQRRAALWQIFVPLGVAVAALLAVMGLTIFVASVPARSVWADVSLMYLIIFAVIGGLVVLALLAGLCAGLWFALRELPGYFKIAQDFMLLVASRAAELSQKIAGYFIAPRASVSAAQKALDSTRSIITTRRKP
jgi:hypothetical protein